ncbi:MAG: response regulator [Planctomycetes bacterium]|nr:response regulator [Planctomycetota bacterium]
MEQLRILLVDHEEEFAATLAERLVLRGFQAEVATSGLVALGRVREDDFNVLILDVKMPGIGGLGLMVEIRRKRPDVPVILLTGHGSVVDAEMGMKAGAVDYLMKPIDIDELIEKIWNAVGREKGP